MTDLTKIEKQLQALRPKSPSPQLSQIVLKPPGKIDRITPFWLKAVATFLIVTCILWRQYESYKMRQVIQEKRISLSVFQYPEIEKLQKHKERISRLIQERKLSTFAD